MSSFIDITGQTFGRLTVLNFAYSKNHKSYWNCKCVCGNEKIIRGDSLKSGAIKSCGCISKELNQTKEFRDLRRKYNKFDLTKEYGIGYTSNTNKPFYFDLEDYDKIKEYCWYEYDEGYIVTNLPHKDRKYTGRLRIHRLVTNAPIGTDVDHINHNVFDNRKCNLRVTSHENNMKNLKLNSNNTSGYVGVSFDKRKNKWCGRICVKRKNYFLGYYQTPEEAYEARKEAEEKYFGEYSYDNSQEIAKVNNIKEVI